jgi:hypothetical protein
MRRQRPVAIQKKRPFEPIEATFQPFVAGVRLFA